MFRTILISGIVLVLIALVVLISGGPVLAVTLFLISEIGLFELYRALKIQEKDFSPLAAVGYLGTAVYYGIVFLGYQSYTMAVILGILILVMTVYVFTFPKYQTEQITGTFFGVLYAPVMLSCIYELRGLENGVYLVWLIFLGSWGCDTCAYCVGKLIGKHKMAPVLSPKKSVEGGIGGVAGAALLGVIYAAATSGPMAEYALICAVGALISMVGDLAASAIKRNQGIKDYGKLIPGHGGILDRFDSVIFTAPAIYFLAKLVLGI